MQKLRILFIGTGEFAVPVFKALLGFEDAEIVGVVTQPDKPVGRDQQLEGGPLKQSLENLDLHGIPVFQPEKLRAESQTILNETNPELIIVAAYGQMIPDDMLTQPRLGALNLHGSLLPQLRGAVPVPMAILQGLKVTGVTIFKLVKALDAGEVYAQREVEISPADTTESLKAKLAEVSVEMLHQLLPQLASGTANAIPQDESQATFCYEADIAKDKAEITFQTPVEMAERMVRAFYPWPIAWFNYPTEQGEKRVKVFAAQIFPGELPADVQQDKLEIIRLGKQLLLVLNDGVLELLDLQMESKNRHAAVEYLFLADRKV